MNTASFVNYRMITGEMGFSGSFTTLPEIVRVISRIAINKNIFVKRSGSSS